MRCQGTDRLSQATVAMAVSLIVICAAACQFARQAARQPAAGPITEAGKLLPDRLSSGLSLKTPVERYQPNDLWKKINGAAELFLSYGFCELLAAAYSRPNAPLPDVEVSVYRMDSDLNALGVYLAERTEDAQRLAVGWEAHQTGDSLFFHKGPYYVKIVDLSEKGSPLGDAPREIARHIDKSVALPRRTVAELEVFPEKGKIANSTLYIHRDAFGHGFLQKVFKADYEIAGKTATLFYCRHENPADLLAKYRDFGQEFGKIEREWEDGGMRLLSIRAFGRQEVVFARGQVFGGVLGSPDQPAALDLIQTLLQKSGSER